MQPAVGVENFLAGFGVVEIALHQVVAANLHFTGNVGRLAAAAVADTAHLHPRHRPATGVGDQFRRVAGPADRGEPTDFRQAIRGDDGGKAQFVAHAVDHLHRNRCRPGHRNAQGAQVEFTALRMGKQRLIQRRWPGQHGDAFALHAFEHGLHVEHLLRQEGAATHQRCQPAGLVAEGVEERIDDQVAIALAQTDDIAPVPHDSQVLAVAGHHAFGFTSGARGEQHVGQGLRANALFAGAQGQLRHIGRQIHKPLPGQGARIGTTHADDVAQGWQVFRRQHAGVVRAEEFADGKQYAGAAFAQDVAGLAALHPGIERHQGGTDTLQGASRNDPLPHVRRPDRHAVPDLYVEGQQCAGSLAAQLVQLSVADGVARVLDGRAVAVGLGRVGEQLSDGQCGGDRRHGASPVRRQLRKRE
ncbi:hypothetical protein D3C85_879500 [compost metagenome]